MNLKALGAAVLASLALAACGGGGGGGGAYGGVAPVTNTGTGSTTPASTATVNDTSKKSSISALVNPTNNLPLYTWAGDTAGAGTSNCTSASGCTGTWPPFLAASGAMASGNYTIIARGDGTQQWAYKGLPLYNYAGDNQADTANGDGIVAYGSCTPNGCMWSLATP